ncbi:hypothetical protein SAMN05444266_102223 [Chitinophaga jiangningensis]|uniref:Uncharacterized protein n=1 Tax=Chitinophaga jiangningensis TaxID=1419482 RepID=A0A1M6YAE1_9BACT|nr:hypothetical protein [Chitinophaga jiangningensis]SHL15133.1 hypothetical protein SAMN05444266_102223 [Chitinophaga jiangningensis]
MHQLTFTDVERKISVSMATTLKDPLNRDEQFYLAAINGITSYLDQQLFYCWSKGVPYTLNEMVYFAEIQQLNLKIFADTSDVPVVQFLRSAA